MHPTDAAQAEHEERLSSLREQIVARMGNHRANQEALSAEASRPGTDRTAPTDSDARVISGLSKNDAQTLERIDRAMGRVTNGTYGICKGCSEPIPLKRLQALPFAELCCRCQEREEEIAAAAAAVKSNKRPEARA